MLRDSCWPSTMLSRSASLLHSCSAVASCRFTSCSLSRHLGHRRHPRSAAQPLAPCLSFPTGEGSAVPGAGEGGDSPLQLLHPLLLLPAAPLGGLGGEEAVGLSAVAALGQILQRGQAEPGTGAGGTRWRGQDVTP